jgi:hypothetical protein
MVMSEMVIDLGDSGIKRIPIPRTKGQIIPIPTTVRHDAAPGRLRVAIDIQSVLE